jgi:hypothetical protein
VNDTPDKRFSYADGHNQPPFMRRDYNAPCKKLNKRGSYECRQTTDAARMSLKSGYTKSFTRQKNSDICAL